MTPRRFPPPWSIEDIGACFLVKEAAAKNLRSLIARKSPAETRRGGSQPISEAVGALR
jgi:hypothetical protein